MESVHRMRNFLLIEGILLIFFGVLALVLPGISTLSFTLVLGFLLLFSGIMQGVRSIQHRHESGFWPSLLSSLLFLFAGFYMVEAPWLGIQSLTAVITLFFILEGMVKIAMGIQFKRFRNWGWLILSGVVSLFLAFIVIQGWPTTALWLVGTLVGIYFLFFGIALISLAMETPSLRNI